MRITIVGAGYTGTTLATELATSFDTDVEICLVGAPGNFGCSIAYGDARGEHLLNTRAGQLGATSDSPAGFAQWLNLSTRAHGAFLPRIAYGEYLRDRLGEAEATSTNLTSLEHEVVDIEHVPSVGYRVHLDDGTTFMSDRVVLALGALPPQRLPGVGPRLARDPRYIASPWQEDDLERIAPDARLLIAGTGLTMVDVISTLRRRGHRGQIVALSRHGLLPQPHTEVAADPEQLPPNILMAVRQSDLHALVSAVRSVTRVVDDWRAIVDALRPHIQDCWRGMSQLQRARFMRHVRVYWENHRHRMAPKSAEEIAAARADGQLEVIAGRLLRAGITETGVSALIRPRGRIGAERHSFDALIRATGLDTDITRTTHPLVQHLVAAGTIAPDPLGLGMRVSQALEVLDTENRPVPGLYCIGALARGECWELTAIGELRSAVYRLAQRLRTGADHAASSVPGGVAARYGTG